MLQSIVQKFLWFCKQVSQYCSMGSLYQITNYENLALRHNVYTSTAVSEGSKNVLNPASPQGGRGRGDHAGGGHGIWSDDVTDRLVWTCLLVHLQEMERDTVCLTQNRHKFTGCHIVIRY